MNKFNYKPKLKNIKKTIKKFLKLDFFKNKKHWLWILLAVLLIAQAERFVRNGTILGYEVRSVSSKQAQDNRSASGGLLGASQAGEQEKSKACEIFTEDKVSKVVDLDLERVAGFVKDTTEPNLISNCSYKTKGSSKDKNAVGISILYREKKDTENAKKTIEILKQDKNGEDIGNLGDEAYFNKGTNQLNVRKDNKIITVTVSGKVAEGKDRKDLAKDIAKLSL